MHEEFEWKRTAFWEEASAQTHTDRRSQKRVPLVFPILVCGMDAAGRFYSRATLTRNISEHGCCFESSVKYARGDVVAIRVVSRKSAREVKSESLLFQIEWVRREGNLWVVGAACLQQQTLWKMAFPPQPIN